MYCKKCGKPIEEGTVYCSACGQNQGQPTEQPPRIIVVQERPVRQKIPGYGMAKASLVLGIIGLLLFFPALLMDGCMTVIFENTSVAFTSLYAFIFPIPGLILGIVGYNRVRYLSVGTGKAVAGIILNGLTTVMFVLLILFTVLGL